MAATMLRGPRLILRAPEPSDLDAFCRWENDTSAWESGSTFAPLSRHQLYSYIANYSADIVGEHQLRLVAEVDGSPVGAIDLFDFDALNARCGVGIIIDPAMRGRHLALEALTLTADYARRRLGLRQLWCHVAEDNKASRRLFEAAGFEISGCLRSWLRRGAEFKDVVIYQLLF
nr:GNAT family N-acetyltransferase [Bacteroides sp.]